MIRVGLIGAGAMGRLHARTVHAHPAFNLVGVFDRHAQRAEHLASEFGGQVGIPDAVDLLIVATPASSHVEVATPYVGRVAVLVEKPLAPTAIEASPLVHPNVFVGMSERFSVGVPDSFGTARRIEGIRLATRSERGRDVDVISDLLVHDVDRVLAWAGDCSVEEAAGTDGPQGFDSVRVVLRTHAGRAFLSVSRVAARSDRSFMADGRALAPLMGPDALTAQLTALQRALTGHNSKCATSREAKRALQVCDEVRRLARGFPSAS